MNNLKTILLPLFAVFALAVSSVHAEEAKVVSAPFGLEWGQSKDDIRKLGVKFSGCSDEGAYEHCGTDSLPKNVPHLSSYRLAISPKYGLIEVLYESDIIGGNKDGRRAKSRYKEFKSLISAKYGEPSTKEYVDESHLDSSLFYDCLETEECGNWASYWEPVDGGDIELRIQPDLLSGVLLLFYLSPDYYKALQEHAKDAF